MVASHGYSERRACRLTRQHGSTQRKPSTRDPRLALRQRMREIVATRIRFGYSRVHIMLRREGWGVGRDLVYRVYREEGLALRSKRPRRNKMAVHRETRRQPSGPNEAWSLDFVHDHLADGGKFRLLTVIDVFSREALAMEIGRRMRAVKMSLACSTPRPRTGCAEASVRRQRVRVYWAHGRSVGLSPRPSFGLL
jgi:putative transposase